MTSTLKAPRSFADAEQRLATALPGYTARPAQQRLASLVEDALDGGRHALAEAGTGTGKSLGTLIPSILWAHAEGKRVVYSTATKALQEQIFAKDLPFLQQHLGVNFTYALLKGRSNYFCKNKAATADRGKIDVAALEAELAAEPEHSGDREHFQAFISAEGWRQVSATKDECPGRRKCPFGEQCFAERAKDQAKVATVVVVNHMLTFTDVKIREVTHGFASMLGEYDVLVLDEAHEIEEIATNAMTDVLREAGIRRLATEAINFAADWRVKEPQHVGEEVLGAVGTLWRTLPSPDPKSQDKSLRLNLPWWVDNADTVVSLIEALREMADFITNLDVQGEKAEAHRGRIVQVATNYATTLVALLTEDDWSLVRWVEREDTGTRVVKSAPLRVGPWLTEGIWSRVPSILVSATMSVSGDFSYIIDRLSVPSPLTMNVGTPFDFTKQAMLFVPNAKMPSPKERSAWLTTTPVMTMDLIDAAKGGALLLYTSRSSMQQAHADLSVRLAERGIKCFMQGGDDGTNKEIAKKFSEDEHSCLFALKSFFTGVDFQGDTCRLVVIDKLPFPVPSDVMFAARSAEVERQGKSSFSAMSIPAMTLTLLQGFGRLIRHADDKGVVAILDSRLESTPWGRRIVKSMPNAPVTTEMDRVRSFFG